MANAAKTIRRMIREGNYSHMTPRDVADAIALADSGEAPAAALRAIGFSARRRALTKET